MTSRFDVLTQQLFQKNIADCSVEELQELANAHPYFAPAQYALLIKLKETDYTSYEKQFQKTILYYHDPLAFDRFINEDQYQVDDSAFTLKEVALPIETQVENIATPVPEIYQRPEEKEEVLEGNTELSEEQLIADNSPEIVVNNVPAEIAVENKEEEKIVTEEVPQINSEFNQQEEITSQAEEMTEAETEVPVITSETTKPETQKEATTNDNALVFEPYHTVDYFASQGIKLSQEEATKDKFGKQLKSFTEWLKTMKKLPVVEQAKPIDTVAEQKVESLAAHSVEGEDVYTETMAEVWVRQGNKQKAIEIYNKLSLQNPSKRAYFAAKINSLN